MPKKLISIARYISQVVAGTVLMMWGVMNFSIQLIAWRSRPDTAVGEAARIASEGWVVAWILTGLLSLLPFVVGMLLLRSIMLQPKNEKLEA